MSRRWFPLALVVLVLSLGTVSAASSPALAQVTRAGTATTVCTGELELVRVDGRVKGNKIPAFELELYFTTEAVETPVAIVQVMMLIGGETTRATAPAPNKLRATLYDVDAQGNRTKVKSKNAKWSRDDGGAEIAFENIPEPSDHFVVRARLKGGAVEDNVLMAMFLGADAAMMEDS